jgi:NAD(P)-dependent dehydrogenase (short-subunit alcohol dehydrogenase family)
MSGAKVALVTGANKGIGYEIAAGLGALGHRVGVAAREEGRREAAVEKLRAEGVDAFGVALDVTFDESVRAAAEVVEEQVGRLDVLVNNAGIGGAWPQDPTTLDLDVLRTVLDTNVFGVIRVTNALLPMLRRSAAPRIVNVSSNMGSLTLRTGPIMAAYAPSKTLLNAVTVQYARQLAGTGILVNAACPGYVATDFTGHQGSRTPEQGAATPLRLATLPADGPTGSFFDDGGVVPW